MDEDELQEMITDLQPGTALHMVRWMIMRKYDSTWWGDPRQLR